MLRYVFVTNMEKNVYILVFLFLQICSSRCQRDTINIIFNNTYQYGKEYELTVNNTVEYVMEFEDPAGQYVDNEYPARVFVSSHEANRTYPIFITARQQKGILSWQLPLLVTTQEFKTISRTLCPNRNFFLEERKTCKSMEEDVMSTPILHITTSSPSNKIVLIRVDLVENFYLKVNGEYRTSVTPSEPKYYYYSFDHGFANSAVDLNVLKATFKHQCNIGLNDYDKSTLQKYLINNNLEQKYRTSDNALGGYSWDKVVDNIKSSIFSENESTLDETLRTVRIVTQSNDDVCMMISIQNASCPVFDNEREILYEGHYETVTRKGAMTVTKKLYPEGFYVVFIVKSTNEDCIGHAETENTSFFDWNQPTFSILNDVLADADRSKNLTFRIVPSVSYSDYVRATTAFIGAFIIIYFLFLFGILCCSRRYNQSYSTMQNPEAHNTPVTNESQPDRTIPNMNSSLTISGSGPDSLVIHHGTPRTINSETGANNIDFLPSNFLSDHSGPDNIMNDVVGASTTVQFPGGDTLRSPSDIAVTTNGINATTVSVADDSDSSVDTDVQSEYSTLDDANTNKDIFRLPPVVTLAHLAKKRPRVLETRSYLYTWHVLIVAVFYGLPVVQLVITYQRTLNRSGNQDLCYYNFLCSHPLGLLSDFNHVFSNVGYVLLGILFMLLVWRRQMLQKTRECSPNCGIPQHFGLFYAMGFSLIMEGILSGSYHVCPNHSNFQFDTSFMYIIAVLIMVKIYQTRHPDINARAHATFIVLACIIFMGLIGVLYSNFYIWVAFTTIHIFACLALTFQIYYMGRFRLDCKGICRSIKEWLLVDLRSSPKNAMKPKYVARMILLILANLANWAIAGFGVYQHEKDFASHLLQVLMGNSILYTFFYITMKMVHREKIAFYSWLFICAATFCWCSALYFFLNPSTSWAHTPAQSRTYNQQCMLLNFYDPHDIWHALSAGAMFFSFLVLLTLDDGMSKMPRNKIPVF